MAIPAIEMSVKIIDRTGTFITAYRIFQRTGTVINHVNQVMIQKQINRPEYRRFIHGIQFRL